MSSTDTLILPSPPPPPSSEGLAVLPPSEEEELVHDAVQEESSTMDPLPPSADVVAAASTMLLAPSTTHHALSEGDPLSTATTTTTTTTAHTNTTTAPLISSSSLGGVLTTNEPETWPITSTTTPLLSVPPPQPSAPTGNNNSLSDFLHDAQHVLGRANGNLHRRIPPVPGVHDGQVMVRLKKKRFVVLDYTMGKTQCTVPSCTKVGVPQCLYDSHAVTGEPTSLYQRSGLCFDCQRNLNEKRRADRRKSGTANASATTTTNRRPTQDMDETQQVRSWNPAATTTTTIRHLQQSRTLPPSAKRPKWNHSHGTSSTTTLIPSSGTTVQQVGDDVLFWTRQGLDHVTQLIQSSGGSTTQDSTVVPEGTTNTSLSSSLGDGGPLTSLPPSDDTIVSSLYEQASRSLNQALLVLDQWKTVWDASTTSRIRSDHHSDMLQGATALLETAAGIRSLDGLSLLYHPTNNTTNPTTTTTTTSNHAGNTPSMASLLLAATQDKEHHDNDEARSAMGGELLIEQHEDGGVMGWSATTNSSEEHASHPMTSRSSPSIHNSVEV